MYYNRNKVKRIDFVQNDAYRLNAKIIYKGKCMLKVIIVSEQHLWKQMQDIFDNNHGYWHSIKLPLIQAYIATDINTGMTTHVATSSLGWTDCWCYCLEDIQLKSTEIPC